jgi:foldase protein PrsA
MRKLSSRIAALGAFFVAGLALAGCGSGVPGNSVADVSGNPISTQAFNHWMYVAAKSAAAQSQSASPVIVPNDPPQFNGCVTQVRREIPTLAKTSTKTLRADCKQLFTTLSSQVMNFLITGYWYQAEAARHHIKVTPAQVQQAFTTAKNRQFTSDAQFQTFLTSTGQTQPDILFRFRISQIVSKLIAGHTVKVTPATIQNYYNTHLTQFGTPGSRDLRIVLTKTAAQASAAKRALQSGQSWNTVAKRYSVDPTSRNTGGLLKGVVKGQEDAALDAAAFSAPANKLLGPLKGQFGYYVFEVLKITPATRQTLAQATPLITQTLVGQQQSSAQTAVTKLVRKNWLKQTTCRSAYATSDCSGYKAPKGSPTTTTPAG